MRKMQPLYSESRYALIHMYVIEIKTFVLLYSLLFNQDDIIIKNKRTTTHVGLELKMELALFYKRYKTDSSFKLTKLDFFQAIERRYPSLETLTLFANILDIRLTQLSKRCPETNRLNLASKLASDAYQQLIRTDCHHLSDDNIFIESLALHLFDNFADFWCEFEIYRLKKKYVSGSIINESILTPPAPVELTYHEQDYTGEFFPDIAMEQTYYLTQYFKQPLVLSDAVLLCNLCSFIKEHQWYEMLYSLDLSTQGPHIILSTSSLNRGVELIVSTARIQYWHHQSQWIYFSPFFQSNIWEIKVTKGFEKILKEVVELHTNTKINYDSIASFDESIINAIANKQTICEVLRLTTSGTKIQNPFILYLSHKKMMSLLMDQNISLSFIVTEQPFMIHYYDSLDNDAYIYMASSNLYGIDTLIYKGLWVIEKLNRHLSRSNYKDYKQRIIYQRKIKKQTFSGVTND